jgi:uncharacterized membrane protein YfcA
VGAGQVMWNFETVLAVSLIFALAGAVKGVIGLGLPSVSLAILTIFFGLQPAMSLLLVPSLVTNVWQACDGGRMRELLRRLWLFLLCAAGGIWAGVEILAGADTALLAKLLGVLLAAYAVLGLTTPKMALPAAAERWAGPVLGAINGVLTGLTGSFVVPGVPYLQALGLSRDTLVQAMGILFTISTLAVAIALQGKRLISGDQALMSLAAVAPAVIGMMLGQRIRRRLSEPVFRKVLFFSLLALGLYNVVR